MVPTHGIPAVLLLFVLLCSAFRRNHSILVTEGYDPEKKKFFRPLAAASSLVNIAGMQRREIREELSQEIQNPMFIGPAENIFEYKGQMAHELIFIFEAEFLDPEPYKHDVIYGQGDDNTPVKAIWKPLADFKRKKDRLYPAPLLDMLMG